MSPSVSPLGDVLARLTCVLLSALLLVSCAGEDNKQASDASKSATPSVPADEADGVNFQEFKGEGFSVLMPGKPRRHEETADSAVGKLTVVLHISEVGEDQAYVVGYTDLPAGASISLPGAIQGAASNVKGTVTDEVASKHHGLAARDARIIDAVNGDDKGTVWVRVIESGDRLYQLQYVERGADVKKPPAEYSQFLESMKIG